VVETPFDSRQWYRLNEFEHFPILGYCFVGAHWVGEADNHGDEANYNRLNHYSSRVSLRHAATRFSRWRSFTEPVAHAKAVEPHWSSIETIHSRRPDFEQQASCQQ
jgi:hypothetical protein